MRNSKGRLTTLMPSSDAMRFTIHMQDLREDWISRIREVLRYDLAEEIEDATASGIDYETAEVQVIDDYLNRHNTGWELDL